MRIPSHPNFIPLAAGLLVATLAVPAAAGSFYKYETDDGGIAFTDDAKRIPARYRDEAETIEQKNLDDFERFTPMGTARPAPHAARMDERLVYLRDMNARVVTPDAVRAPSGVGPGGLTFRTGRDGQDIEASLSPRRDGEPVIVEKIRSRPDGSPVTRHITIVRQGDEILSIIAPEQRHSSTRAFDERALRD
jgi:hypothetical protein